MIQIYGSPRSSAGRCYWLMEELGLSYERMPMDMRAKDHKSEAYLKLNPNGKVPTLKDGELVIWESMAINTYLAEKAQSPLLGKSPEAKGLIQQWSYWSLLELQKPIIDIFIQVVFTPEDKRDQAVIERATKSLPPLFTILDQALKARKYLVGNEFTLADLHAASVVRIAAAIQYDISAYKNVGAWLHNLQERPAYRKYAAME